METELKATVSAYNPRPARVIALAAGLVLAISLILPDGGDGRKAPGPSLCLFHSVTGFPCPGCGLTRAFSSLSRGKMARAWELNPFAFPLYAATVAAVFAPLWWRRVPRNWENRPVVRWGVLILMAGMLAHGVARIAWTLFAAAP